MIDEEHLGRKGMGMNGDEVGQLEKSMGKLLDTHSGYINGRFDRLEHKIDFLQEGHIQNSNQLSEMRGKASWAGAWCGGIVSAIIAGVFQLIVSMHKRI